MVVGKTVEDNPQEKYHLSVSSLVSTIIIVSYLMFSSHTQSIVVLSHFSPVFHNVHVRNNQTTRKAGGRAENVTTYNPPMDKLCETDRLKKNIIKKLLQATSNLSV